MAFKVHFIREEVTASAAHGELLADVMRRAGIELDEPCGGRGNCGKCKDRVLDGELKISTMDRIQLTEDELSLGIRLACQAMPKQTVKIEI